MSSIRHIKMSLLLTLLIWLFSYSLNAQILNMSYELLDINTHLPISWRLGNKSMQIEIDSIISYHGKYSLRFSYIGQDDSISIQQAYGGAVTKSIPAQVAARKKLTITARIKTNNVTIASKIGFQIFARGSNGEERFSVTTDSTIFHKTCDWKLARFIVMIPDSITTLNLGPIVLGNNGTVWFDDIHIELNDVDYNPLQPTDPTQKQLTWLKQNVVTLPSQIGKIRSQDFQQLKKEIGNARVIALGEATHGTSEFTRLKKPLLEFLVKEMKVRIIAIEDVMPETYTLNDYILYGKGKPEELLTGWIYGTKEMLEIIHWLHSYNQTTREKVLLWGFDMQTYKQARKNIRVFFQKVDTVEASKFEKFSKQLDSLRREFSDDAISQQKALQVINKANLFKEHITTSASSYTQYCTKNDISIVTQDVNILIQALTIMFTKYLPTSKPFDAPLYRDSCMAENVSWLHSQVAKHERIAIWAHNGHISKQNDPLGIPTVLGQHLARIFSRDYFAIAFTCGNGTYSANIFDKGSYKLSDSLPIFAPYNGTVEKLFHDVNIPLSFVSLRKISSNQSLFQSWFSKPLGIRSIGSVSLTDQFTYYDKIHKSFDALFYIEQTTSSQLIDQKQK